MRNTFIQYLGELAKEDKNVNLVTGDLGFSVFEDFASRFPDQYLNCGVSEQNMIGVAAGMALSGRKPYVYSIIPFLTMRPFEQVRNDICYNNLNVKLIGAGAGFSYGHLGVTHYAIEDLAILRALPNIMIFSPADIMETEQLLKLAHKSSNPVYLRIERTKGVKLYSSPPLIELGKPSVVRDGKDGVIFATGGIVETCAKAVSLLKEKGYELKLLSMHTIKPVNTETVLSQIGGRKYIFSVEEHTIFGGLGSVVAEILAESGWNGHFKRFGVPGVYPDRVGEAEFLRKTFHISAESLAEQIIKNYEL